MKYETRVIEFTAKDQESKRPAVVMEVEGGRIISLKLLTGRSGNADISVPELLQLAEIVNEAAEQIRELDQPSPQLLG